MTCTARRLEIAQNGQPLNHRNATEPATCRKLLDLSGTTGNVGTTRCSLDFADASGLKGNPFKASPSCSPSPSLLLQAPSPSRHP